ncbi:DUF2252 domain-containing protein [Actinoplanes xinjiangensis]|uniref:Uncharacterized protein (DUF2252 family) n=1 Tax=Actinoplanes xinjiangensis TaxID=512350 RepID=A0A316FFH6_9ACTN|nr:DUF2252 domain-containing protein [Actinoplanes xinjiangensis]PWK47149.1 uncharacterized protein (DUF2252 family) [Actinoplanes xinjiangensis]GIF40307.1 hypothetical protein Axi01nite_46180 [Actinoplanes xinjiangensis]
MTGTVARDPAARAAAGKAARERAPLDGHAEFVPAADRPDPVAVLRAQEDGRVPELLPIRHQRMTASPLAFYRAAAATMAADLAALPSTGLVSRLCGDAHLLNFGAYASPERRLVFDLNDFDESHPGPWEWDVKRLVASLALAGRENGFKRRQRAAVVQATARHYRDAMRGFATMRELDVWYARADMDELRERLTGRRGRRVAAAGAKARSRDGLQAYHRLTVVDGDRRRLAADPPLLVPIGDLMPGVARKLLEDQIRELLAGYRRSLADDRRRLFDAFDFVDMARKVVGVGSVGTRCWVVLLTGRDDADPLLLQVKEAGPSVLAGKVGPIPVPDWDSDGRRVVSGQRILQATSDIFLGWHSAEGIDGQARDFYVRQLRDWKGGADVASMDPEGLLTYGRLCGWTLARAHARGGDRIAIAAYLGSGERFDRAMVPFAEAYADQTEADHAAFAATC